ncbi:MAG TPA: hypothetical protein VGO62_13095 [Myxococcota bacterium]|jgi:hypothetical protein
MARWRDGACPVHGLGFVDDAAAPASEQARAMKCGHLECTVKVARFPGPDDEHASFGWREGPDEIRALLAKAGDIAAEGDRPGKRARTVRTTYALE